MLLRVAQATDLYMSGAFFIYKRYVSYAGLFVSFVSEGGQREKSRKPYIAMLSAIRRQVPESVACATNLLNAYFNYIIFTYGFSFGIMYIRNNLCKAGERDDC